MREAPMRATTPLPWWGPAPSGRGSSRVLHWHRLPFPWGRVGGLGIWKGAANALTPPPPGGPELHPPPPRRRRDWHRPLPPCGLGWSPRRGMARHGAVGGGRGAGRVPLHWAVWRRLRPHSHPFIQHHVHPPARPGAWGGGGGWHKASASDCLPLAAPIGLSPLLILTLCGSERILLCQRSPRMRGSVDRGGRGFRRRSQPRG